MNESGGVDFLPCRCGKAHVNVCHAAQPHTRRCSGNLFVQVAHQPATHLHPTSISVEASLSTALLGNFFSFSREREREMFVREVEGKGEAQTFTSHVPM